MKIFDISGFAPDSLNLQKSLSYQQFREFYGIGLYGGFDKTPRYAKGNLERVIEGNSNSLIVLGKDRRAGIYDGYGGIGGTNAGSIDLVTGLGGDSPKLIDSNGQTLFYNKDFQDDSARIYISQKTSLDDYLGLSQHDSEGKSGILLKSDVVRIIGRENIRLHTYVDPKNSRGDISRFSGVDLIAGKDDKNLQSIPKGENLISYLSNIEKQFGNVLSILDSLVDTNINLVDEVSKHTHISPFFAKHTLQSEKLLATSVSIKSQLQEAKKNIRAVKYNSTLLTQKFLKPTSETFINSRYHNVD